MYIKPDLHMHTDWSDGTDAPGMLLENVRASGVDVFALTDHDEYRGCLEIKKMLRDEDPAFINGIEFSCRADGKKYHILGYGFDMNDSEVTRLAARTSAARKAKLEERIEYLSELGYSFKEEQLVRLRSVHNPGKPHLRDELIRLDPSLTKNAAMTILNARREEEGYETPESAIKAIIASGGIPVLAHGIKADGRENLSETEIEERIKSLISCGLQGLECYYSEYTDEQQEIMLKLAGRYGMLVTAGSDYHAKTKTHIAMGDTHCREAERIKPFIDAVMR